MDLLDRYLAGDCVLVHDELIEAEDAIDRAVQDAIATEMMRRVRRNIATLIERWKERGWMFGYEWAIAPASIARLASDSPPLVGLENSSDDSIQRIEARFGRLPATIRAFWKVVGAVNFVGCPDDTLVSASSEDWSPWPAQQEIDPLQVCGAGRHDEWLHNGEDVREFPLYPDFVMKYGYAGVGWISFALGRLGFDPPLRFEGGDMAWRGRKQTFARELRMVILEGGGMGCVPLRDPDQTPGQLRQLARELVSGLERF